MNTLTTSCHAPDQLGRVPACRTFRPFAWMVFGSLLLAPPVLAQPLILPRGSNIQRIPQKFDPRIDPSKLKVVLPPQPPRVTSTGRPTSGVQNTPNGPFLCSTQRYNVRASPAEYAAKSLDQDKLWVGALVKSARLSLGSMQTVNIPDSRRNPLRLTSMLPTAAGSATIAPNQTAYNQAVARVRQQAVGVPLGSTIRYEITEQSNAETSALKLGLNASGLVYNVKAAGSLDTQNRNNRISAAFVQNTFTMNADLGGQSPHEALLKAPTEADLAAVRDEVYIDSVTYGRLLFVEMTSTYSSQEMKAALSASYAGSSGSASAQQSRVLQESRFNVYAAGGSEQEVINLIRTQRLGSYFGRPADPRTLVPISFTARNFVGGAYAVTAGTGDFAESVCNPNFVKVALRVSYRLITPNDSKYDDLYGSLDLDGQRVWTLPSDRHTALYRNQTVSLHTSGAAGLTLNYGEARSLSLNARLMDYDSGPNDVIGMWNEAIDLAAVAEQFRSSGQPVVRREFPKRGEDDANGVLIVEFVRN